MIKSFQVTHKVYNFGIFKWSTNDFIINITLVDGTLITVPLTTNNYNKLVDANIKEIK